MKTLVFALTFLSLNAFAQTHDGVQGNCEEAAQRALDAIGAINGQERLTTVRTSRVGQVERYTEGGRSPQYKIVTNTGRGERACKVISVTFNANP